MSTPPLLGISEVSIRRGQDTVVSMVSLALEPGGILALTGPNGGGKTSLVRAVLGELSFTGTIRVAARGSGRVGYVPQVFDFDRALPITVRDFLALPLQRFPSWLALTRQARTRIDDVLARVDLPGHADRALGDLSGGELQRALFAQALLPDPELLVLDEPTQGMDAPARARFEDELRRLVADGRVGVLLVSHDPGQMRRLADRVALLDRSLSALGPPEEVLGSS